MRSAVRLNAEIRPYFERLEEICDRNTEKVLAAFAKNRVSDNLFAGTTGYGYDDYGRDTLDKIYADIFGTEAALVRIGFVNGTHALSCAMFSAVKTGDTVLSVTGPAYDTLQNTITGDYCGSMKSYGIGYRQVDLKNGEPDLPAIKERRQMRISSWYSSSAAAATASCKTLSVEEIGEICKAVREVNTTAAIMVDNCYGEFTEEIEPTAGRCGHHRRLAHQESGRRSGPDRRLYCRPCRSGRERLLQADRTRHRRRMRLYDGSEPPAVSGPVHGAACHHAGRQDRDVLRKGHGKARLRGKPEGRGAALRHHPDHRVRCA